MNYYQAYHSGFEAYLTRNFTGALEQFALVLQFRGNDPAAKGMIARITELNPDELPEDWDGSVALNSK